MTPQQVFAALAAGLLALALTLFTWLDAGAVPRIPRDRSAPTSQVRATPQCDRHPRPSVNNCNPARRVTPTPQPRQRWN